MRPGSRDRRVRDPRAHGWPARGQPGDERSRSGGSSGTPESSTECRALARRSPVILVFGEGAQGKAGRNSYDAQAIKALIPALAPGVNDSYDIKVIKDPPSLTRGASSESVRSWMDDIGDTIAAQETSRPVHAVLVHQDADGKDGERRRETLQAQLDEMRTAHNSGYSTSRRKKKKGPIPCPWRICAVVPVQMTEAWWLLFPDSIRALNPGAWRDLKLPTGAVENHNDPAALLTSRTDKHTRGKKKYIKSESPAIADLIARRIIAGKEPDKPARPSSPSWNRFVDDVRALAQNQPPAARALIV